MKLNDDIGSTAVRAERLCLHESSHQNRER